MIFSILKFLTVFVVASMLSACKTTEPFPNELLTRVDIANGVCRDYKLVNAKELIFEGPVARYSLSDSRCDGIFGYRPKAFKNVQNWARDQQAGRVMVIHHDEMETMLIEGETYEQ